MRTHITYSNDSFDFFGEKFGFATFYSIYINVCMRFGFADYFFFFFSLTFWPCLRHWFFDLCIYGANEQASKHTSIWILGQNNDTASNDGDGNNDDAEGKFRNLNHSTIVTQKKSLHSVFSPTVLYPIPAYRYIFIPSSIRFDSCVSFDFGLIETKSRIDILPKIRIACCLSVTTPCRVCDIFSHTHEHTSHTDIFTLMLRTG